MTGKYSVADLTLVAIRCNSAEELQQMEDSIYFLIDFDPDMYSNAEISTIFTVMDGKKTLF
jgi:hypothetical protein